MVNKRDYAPVESLLPGLSQLLTDIESRHPGVIFGALEFEQESIKKSTWMGMHKAMISVAVLQMPAARLTFEFHEGCGLADPCVSAVIGKIREDNPDLQVYRGHIEFDPPYDSNWKGKLDHYISRKLVQATLQDTVAV